MTLQALCAARGLTLADLAARAGVPGTIVAKIDAGTIRAQPATLDRLATPLGLSPRQHVLVTPAREPAAAG